MEREVYKVKEDGDNVLISINLILTKEEYAQYRQSFIKEFNELETQIKKDKGEIINMRKPEHPKMDPNDLKMALEYIQDETKKDILRDSIKQNEKIYEKSRMNCKTLKTIE